MAKNSLIKALLEGFRSISAGKWTKARAKCNACGNEWNVTFPTGGPEKRLQCSKCNARNSKILYYR